MEDCQNEQQQWKLNILQPPQKRERQSIPIKRKTTSNYLAIENKENIILFSSQKKIKVEYCENRMILLERFPIPNIPKTLDEKRKSIRRSIDILYGNLINSQNEQSTKEIPSESVLSSSQTIENQAYPNLNMDDFQIGELLGRGAEATARIMFHKPTGSIFCLRSVNRKRVEGNMSKFIEAIKMQVFLDHQNVAKIYGIMLDNEQVHIIMEYCHDGNLSENKFEFEGNESKLCKLLKTLAITLDDIHLKKVQHRDLKLENILLNFGVPKISDFELSVHMKLPTRQRRTICGSPLYFSPEMLKNNSYNFKADIWCLGIIFYEMICKTFPFDMKDMNDLSQIKEGNIKKVPPGTSSQAENLLLSMLEINCHRRIGTKDIINHPYLNQQI